MFSLKSAELGLIAQSCLILAVQPVKSTALQVRRVRNRNRSTPHHQISITLNRFGAIDIPIGLPVCKLTCISHVSMIRLQLEAKMVPNPA